MGIQVFKICIVGAYIYICNHIDLAYGNISFKREDYAKEKDLGSFKAKVFLEFFEI